MSSSQGYGECEVCGGTTVYYADTHGNADDQCLECGFHFYTTSEYLPLEAVNELREEQDLEPLESLRKAEERRLKKPSA